MVFKFLLLTRFLVTFLSSYFLCTNGNEFGVSLFGVSLKQNSYQITSANVLARSKREDLELTSLNRLARSVSEPECVDENQKFESETVKRTLNSDTSNYTLEDNSATSMIVDYIGTQNSPMLLAISETAYKNAGKIWKSGNYGKTFTEIGMDYLRTVSGAVESEDLVLYPSIFQHGTHADHVVLFGWILSSTKMTAVMFYSDDCVQSFKCYQLDFDIDSVFLEQHFLWHEKDVSKMLIISEQSALYYSENNGRLWQPIHQNVADVYFLYDDLPSTTIYFLENSRRNAVNGDLRPLFNLIRFDVNNQIKYDLQSDLYGFGLNGKTMYASIEVSSYDLYVGNRKLHVSRDGGNKWFQCNIPTINNDQYYYIVDIEDEIMMIHVGLDLIGQHSGTIYVSDSDALIYTKSLENHAVTGNMHHLTDFYKIESMRGSFLTTVYKSSEEIYSVVSFNRGASWSVPQVKSNTSCDNCLFLVYNKIAPATLTRSFMGNRPLSRPKAPGLLLANAKHYSDIKELDNSGSDFYISRDGGYIWNLIRTGSHLFEILDQGGILVAVKVGSKTSLNEATDFVDVSFDEGACWQRYKFTDQKVYVLEIFTEPSKLSTKLSIWAQLTDGSTNWEVFTIDFGGILSICDKGKDYFEWTPHGDNGQNGCLLGRKETFKRLKTDSFCRNSDSFIGDEPVKSESCLCTEADWECNFGFSLERVFGSQPKCVPDADRNIFDDICDKTSHLEKVQFSAYRKVSGDTCQGGIVHEEKEHIYSTDELCEGTNNLDFISSNKKTSSNNNVDENETEFSAWMVALMIVVCASIGICIVLIYARFYFNEQEGFHSGTLRYSVLTHDNSAVSVAESEIRASHRPLTVNQPNLGRYQSNGVGNEANGTTTVKDTQFSLHVGNMERRSNSDFDDPLQRTPTEYTSDPSNVMSDDEPILA